MKKEAAIASPTDILREKLKSPDILPDILIVPGCWDALSAKLIQRAGFPAAFMGGFAVSAARLGLPDTGLISYGEMVAQGRTICEAVDIPMFGDGDTGYGNAVNVRRTVEGYAKAGFACVMIEDQLSPKRCGHTRGKQIVDRDEAFTRIRAAMDAREAGADILIMARTDARATDGLDEALFRAKTFRDIGADITFLEAPRTIDEMRAYCDAVPGPKMANMVEGGDTPVLPPVELQRIGYAVVAYPLTLLHAGIHAMEGALAALSAGTAMPDLSDFSHLQAVVGFPEYDRMQRRYATPGGAEER